MCIIYNNLAQPFIIMTSQGKDLIFTNQEHTNNGSTFEADTGKKNMFQHVTKIFYYYRSLYVGLKFK